MTKELPILMNGEMVRAILDGRKTQTRRPIKPQPPHWTWSRVRKWSDECIDLGDGDNHYYVKSPFGGVGTHLYVRETTRKRSGGEWAPRINYAQYVATHTAVIGDAGHRHCGRAVWWYSKDTCPSIHMPKWASRITLEVTREWAERVQDISEEDCDAEGIFNESGLHLAHCHHHTFHPDHLCRCGSNSPEEEFGIRWDSIYAKAGFGFDTNCWVFGCEFKVLEVKG